MSGGGGDAGAVTVDEAAKPMTAVQDCVLTFIGGKSPDIFNEKSGHFPGMLMGAKNWYFWQEVRTFLVMLSQPKQVFCWPLCGFIDSTAETGWERRGITCKKEPQAGTRTQGCCSKDKAFVHGMPALPAELNGAPRFKAKPDVSLTLTKRLLCLNLTRE